MLLCLDWASALYACENGSLRLSWFALDICKEGESLVKEGGGGWEAACQPCGFMVEWEFIMVTAVAEVYQNWMNQLKVLSELKFGSLRGLWLEPKLFKHRSTRLLYSVVL